MRGNPYIATSGRFILAFGCFAERNSYQAQTQRILWVADYNKSTHTYSGQASSRKASGRRFGLGQAPPTISGHSFRTSLMIGKIMSRVSSRLSYSTDLDLGEFALHIIGVHCTDLLDNQCLKHPEVSTCWSIPDTTEHIGCPSIKGYLGFIVQICSRIVGAKPSSDRIEIAPSTRRKGTMAAPASRAASGGKFPTKIEPASEAPLNMVAWGDPR